MLIQITEKRRNHCWAVHMDAWEVNFNKEEEAKAFIGKLKARIDAPHAWPIAVDHGLFARSIETRADLVKS